MSTAAALADQSLPMSSLELSVASPSPETNPVHDLFLFLKGALARLVRLSPGLSEPGPGSHHSAHLGLATGAPTPDRSCVDLLRRLLGAGGATELRIAAIPTRVLRVEAGVVSCGDCAEDPLAFGQDTCSICLDGYEKNNRVRVLGCNHVYHSSCIEAWLRRRPTCPMCQTVCC